MRKSQNYAVTNNNIVTDDENIRYYKIYKYKIFRTSGTGTYGCCIYWMKTTRELEIFRPTVLVHDHQYYRIE